MVYRKQIHSIIRALGLFILTVLWNVGCNPNTMAALDQKTTEDDISVSLYSSEPRSTSAAVIPVYASFSEEIAELSINAFRVQNGNLRTLQQIPTSPQTYFLEIVPANIGLVTLEFKGNAVKAKSTNTLIPIQKKQLVFDFYFVGSAVHLSPPSKLFVNSEGSSEYTLTYTGTYTVVVPDLIDLLSLTTVTGNVQCDSLVLNPISDFKYQVQISGCTGNGSVRLHVEAGSASGDSGAFPAMLSAHALTVDNTAPIFSIQSPTSNSGDKDTVFTWRITLDDPTVDLARLTPDDFQWTGDISTCDVLLSSGNTERELIVSGCVGSSTIGFTLAEGAIKDPAGNLTPAITSTTVSFTNPPE